MIHKKDSGARSCYFDLGELLLNGSDRLALNFVFSKVEGIVLLRLDCRLRLPPLKGR